MSHIEINRVITWSYARQDAKEKGYAVRDMGKLKG
jgi:hypothetical protein